MAAYSGKPPHARIYWTAFVGLLFDYYDLYLFIYLERVLAAQFALTPAASNLLQFIGLAGTGAGALGFGWLADRLGRGRIMLAVFGVYALGIGGLSLAWSFSSLAGFRLLASLALGAEWGISHTFLAERVERATRYRFGALLQFAILGGLLAALARMYLLSWLGWRGLFAASIVPIAVLSLVRWRALVNLDFAVASVFPRGHGRQRVDSASTAEFRVVEVKNGRSDADGARDQPVRLGAQTPSIARAGREAFRANAAPFAVCLGLASLTIASGTINVFFEKELPQGVAATVLFWCNVVPGMLAGAWIVRRFGVGRALVVYAVALIVLSCWAWSSPWPSRALAFAVVLPLLNGIPLGLMGAFFNEVFGEYRTLFSGAAYNLGRILAGFSPALITGLGLRDHGRYFLFTALVGAGVLGLSGAAARLTRRL
jgi:putative MFS transporter